MIKITKNTRGVLYALAASLAISNVYIFSKAALNTVHLAQFGVYWFGLGLIWNLLYFFAFGKYKKLKSLKANNWWNLLLISALEMISTLFFFLAIKTVPNPAIVSFLTNINPLFVVALGIFILKERFNRVEFLGMFVTLLGAIIISLTGLSDSKNLFVNGTQYVLISGIVYSLSTLVAKKQIKHLDASFLATSRIVLLFVVSVTFLFSLNLPLTIPADIFIKIGIGSVLGPFLAGILGYMSLKCIEMSKATMVRSVRSLFVLLGAWVYFHSLPSQMQLVGGALTMFGVVLISFGKLKINKLK